MRTTIDLPDDLFDLTKIAAVKRRTSIKNLVVEGLRIILQEAPAPTSSSESLSRLKKGYQLGGKPLSREEAHGR